MIVDRAGTHVLVANYGGGNAAVLSIGPDGRLSDMSGFVQHAASGGKAGRPKAPLAHSINLDKAGRFAFVCDAGVDKVFIYRYDADRGTLSPNDPPAGLAPRMPRRGTLRSIPMAVTRTPSTQPRSA